MESVDAKMIRAHENIFSLAQEINDWFASIKFTFYLNTIPDEPWPRLTVHADEYIPPVRLSVLVGECVHNMRSALDNLICALARTLKPGSKCRGLAFPLFDSQAEWDEKSERPLKGIAPAAREIIRRLQPWVDSASPHPLVILNKLSNIDKHRACNFTLPHNRNAIFLVHCRDGRLLEVTADKPLYLGQPQHFTLPIDKRLVTGGTRVQAAGSLVLTFQEESEWDDMPIMEILQNCFDYIERKVIAPLTPLFRAPLETSRTP
jgi:hypothetical protein